MKDVHLVNRMTASVAVGHSWAEPGQDGLAQKVCLLVERLDVVLAASNSPFFFPGQKSRLNFLNR